MLAGAMPEEIIEQDFVVPVPPPPTPIPMAPEPDPGEAPPIYEPPTVYPTDVPRAWCQRSEDVGKPLSVLEVPSNAWACRETPDRDRGGRDSGRSGQSEGPSSPSSGGGEGPPSGGDKGSESGPSAGDPDKGTSSKAAHGQKKDRSEAKKDKKSKKSKKSKGDKRGHGFGDKNHNHTGEHGRGKHGKSHGRQKSDAGEGVMGTDAAVQLATGAY